MNFDRSDIRQDHFLRTRRELSNKLTDARYRQKCGRQIRRENRFLDSKKVTKSHKDSVLDSLIRAEELRLLKLAIPLLPMRFRIAVELYSTGKSYQAIGKILGVSDKTAAAHYQQALSYLRSKFDVRHN